jgi:hypothetical protein
MRGHPGPGQPLERLAVQLVGGFSVGQQRLGPRRRPAGPVGTARRGDLRQPPRCRGGLLALVAPHRRLHQLVQRPWRDDQLAGGTGQVRGLGGEPVVAEAVVQHGPGVLGDGQRRALAPIAGPLDHLLGQPGGGRRVPPPRGEQQRDVRQGSRPDPGVDALALRQQGRRRRQLTGLDLDLGQVIERERKPAQRAVRAGQPDLAGGELEPRLVVPQVHRDQVVGHEPPVQLLRPGPVAAQRLAEQGSGGRVPVGQPRRQAAEQQLGVRERLVLGRGRCRSGRARDLEHVLPVGQAAGVDGGHQGFQIGLPGQAGVQVLQPLRRPEQQRRRVAPSSQRERDLRPHPLHERVVELTQRADLGRGQECLRGLEIPGCVLRPGRLERARRTLTRVRGEHDGPLPERRGGRHPAPAQGAARGADELAGHGLVGTRRRVRTVPGPAVGVGPGIGSRRERAVRGAPVPGRRGPVDGRTDQGVPEAHVRADAQQSGRHGGIGRPGVQAEEPGRPEDERRVPHRVGGGQQGHLPRLGRELTEAFDVLVLDAPGQVARVREGEPAGQFGRAQAPVEFEQGERIAAGLLDDPGAHALVERTRRDRRQQRARRLVPQSFQLQPGQAGQVIQ